MQMKAGTYPLHFLNIRIRTFTLAGNNSSLLADLAFLLAGLFFLSLLLLGKHRVPQRKERGERCRCICRVGFESERIGMCTAEC